MERWLAKILFLLLLLIIGWLATTSGWQPLQNIDDKLRHIAAFFVLASAMLYAFPQIGSILRLTVFIALGLLLEAVQWLTPHREFHLDDWAASCAGAALFELTYLLLRYLQQQYSRRANP